MSDAGSYNFTISQNAHAQITKLFDFVYPTAIALWNLRWQVQGFVAACPKVTSETLAARFASESNLRGGELRRACVDTSWEDQVSQFSVFILTSAISIYEEFTTDLAALYGGAELQQRRLAKGLQFPTDPSGQKGFAPCLAQLASKKSKSLTNVFKASSLKKRHYSMGRAKELLLCYRFFKEMRNCLSHFGGKANAQAVSAYNQFKPVATVASLGLREVPMHNPVTLLQPIKLELRGVVGLCDIIIKLIVTIDGELSESIYVESEIARRVKPLKSGKMLPADDAKRKSTIANLFSTLQFPRPVVTHEFESLLKTMKIIGQF